MKNRIEPNPGEQVVNTTCSSHCGGSCVLKLHIKAGVITRIETDDAEEPQLRACLRGRAYRQRVYAPDRILHPMKRIGERGEGKFERISWDEALDTVAGEIARVRDTYGPASILYLQVGGDLHNLNNGTQMRTVLSLAGGFTNRWGGCSAQGALYAQSIIYGSHSTENNRSDLINSRLIIMWGWDPASTISGVNTSWYLARAKEAGARIISVDPRYTNSAAAFASKWIPIRPGTDAAVLLAMAHVMMAENLQDQKFLDTYTIGFDRFKDYVTGKEDGVAKTPAWAALISGVPAATIENLAREYAAMKPAALMSGIAPGRTAFGEQYHRIAMTLTAMTGNIGIHGGAAGLAMSWPRGIYPYKIRRDSPFETGHSGATANPVDVQAPRPPQGSPYGYLASRMHTSDVPELILEGKAGGYPADCKLIAVVNSNFVNSFPNVNRIVQALKSSRLEFIFTQEQFMTTTARYADIILPSNTYLERNDIANGMGVAFYGSVGQAIQSRGESKSHLEIAKLLASRLGVNFPEGTEDDLLRDMASTEIPDYEQFKRQGVYRMNHSEPHVAFKRQIEELAPFPTPSGKIEIYSRQLADLNRAEFPPLPRYIKPWEDRDDPLAVRYPLQLITTHFKRRANAQFDNIPWLRELEPQAAWVNSYDARVRDISDGDMVRVFNDRGQMIIPAKVTERITPGVVNVPHGAWYDPDDEGVDRGGCANVLTRHTRSPGGALPFNTCLVQVQKA